MFWYKSHVNYLLIKKYTLVNVIREFSTQHYVNFYDIKNIISLFGENINVLFKGLIRDQPLLNIAKVQYFLLIWYHFWSQHIPPFLI